VFFYPPLSPLPAWQGGEAPPSLPRREGGWEDGYKSSGRRLGGWVEVTRIDISLAIKIIGIGV